MSRPCNCARQLCASRQRQPADSGGRGRIRKCRTGWRKVAANRAISLVQDDGPGRDRTCDLGIKSGRQALVVAGAGWSKRVVEPDQLACSRVLWRGLVDLLLTHTASYLDNAYLVEYPVTCRCVEPALAGQFEGTRRAFRGSRQSRIIPVIDWEQSCDAKCRSQGEGLLIRHRFTVAVVSAEERCVADKRGASHSGAAGNVSVVQWEAPPTCISTG